METGLLYGSSPTASHFQGSPILSHKSVFHSLSQMKRLLFFFFLSVIVVYVEGQDEDRINNPSQGVQNADYNTRSWWQSHSYLFTDAFTPNPPGSLNRQETVSQACQTLIKALGLTSHRNTARRVLRPLSMRSRLIIQLPDQTAAHKVPLRKQNRMPSQGKRRESEDSSRSLRLYLLTVAQRISPSQGLNYYAGILTSLGSSFALKWSTHYKWNGSLRSANQSSHMASKTGRASFLFRRVLSHWAL